MKAATSFKQLALNETILNALKKLGYEQPSAVQAESIPLLLEGRDLLAQAQTGTGKTAAFSLPILERLNLKILAPQALILAPTRELAIQVAEAFQSYAKNIKGFHVLPIYGGQSYQPQLKALKRGVHVVVGTPGRVMDHLRRGTLTTDALKTLVLDEADEMLRMGFIDDVKWILEQIKDEHQTALFSATMPSAIRSVAKRFLKNPAKVHIEPKVKTVSSIEQEYLLVAKKNKLEALTRYFELEELDAALIFTATKTASVDVAEKLAARGYAAVALNGDMSQKMREQAVAKLKRGAIDIIVATEVAARGLDVERVSHVINFDIPQAAESYIHRIGRTGRAGRLGKALLFVTPREQRMFREIEKAVNGQIKAMSVPTAKEVKRKRMENLKADILHTLNAEKIHTYRELVSDIALESGYGELDIAAAIAHLAHKGKALSFEACDEVEFEAETKPKRNRGRRSDRGSKKSAKGKREQQRRPGRKSAKPKAKGGRRRKKR